MSPHLVYLQQCSNFALFVCTSSTVISPPVHVPLTPKDFRRQALIVNAHGHVLLQFVVVQAKGRLVAGINHAGVGAERHAGDAIGSELKLTNVRGELGFRHVFRGDDRVGREDAAAVG